MSEPNTKGINKYKRMKSKRENQDEGKIKFSGVLPLQTQCLPFSTLLHALGTDLVAPI